MALPGWSSVLLHVSWGLALVLATPAAAAAPAAALASVTVRSGANGESSGFDGVVEALRQTVIAAQVQGAIMSLTVKAGDRVRAGQVLVRLDARAALQNATAGDAQVRVARAELEAATREAERQRALFARQYISQAALDRAEAQFKSTMAQVESQVAQANATRTQSGFYVLSAPYAGVISEVSVVQGDMAMPGRALMTIYDPAAMRVIAPVGQSLAARLGSAEATRMTRIELSGLSPERSTQTPTRVTVLPAADPATHTVPVRFDLAAGLSVAPGSFARVWLPVASGSTARFFVPLSALVRRAEVTAVYVLDAGGKPHLRQVRLGRANGDAIEVLAGVADGERVATDPQAAARFR